MPISCIVQEKSISEVSEKRLEAIKGFTELGSGFKIAMRDLSIRGAGNLLGKSQSGFIDSVGLNCIRSYWRKLLLNDMVMGTLIQELEGMLS